MTVILGIRTERNVFLAGDKRATSVNDRFVDDEMNKVAVINDHLAFASGGNASIGKAIEIDIARSGNAQHMTTHDLLLTIKAFYCRCQERATFLLSDMPFSFIIAGTDQDGKPSLIAGKQANRMVESSEVEMMLYPPADVDFQTCADIFVKNYRTHPKEFIERTIREVAPLSSYVSSTGDKWVFDVEHNKGVISSF